jgi:hypothetical protein
MGIKVYKEEGKGSMDITLRLIFEEDYECPALVIVDESDEPIVDILLIQNGKLVLQGGLDDGVTRGNLKLDKSGCVLVKRE